MLPRVTWNMSDNKNKLRAALDSWTSENKILQETFNKTVLILSMKNPSKINESQNYFLKPVLGIILFMIKFQL